MRSLSVPLSPFRSLLLAHSVQVRPVEGEKASQLDLLSPLSTFLSSPLHLFHHLFRQRVLFSSHSMTMKKQMKRKSERESEMMKRERETERSQSSHFFLPFSSLVSRCLFRKVFSSVFLFS